jgi:hypothetical protein
MSKNYPTLKEAIAERDTARAERNRVGEERDAARAELASLKAHLDEIVRAIGGPDGVNPDMVHDLVTAAKALNAARANPAHPAVAGEDVLTEPPDTRERHTVTTPTRGAR